MNQQNQQPENQRDQRQFSQNQYDMLIRCSDKKDMTEWNDWRRKNKEEDICLEGSNFQGVYLNGVLLDENPVQYYGKVYLRSAIFRFSKLKKAKFMRANLEKCDFCYADLTKAYMQLANLKGADFSHSILRGTQIPLCIVNEETMFWKCEIDKSTWMHGVALSNTRIEQRLKQLLEYNIRRINWEEWYKGKKVDEPLWWESEVWHKKWIRSGQYAFRFILTLPVRVFWSFSDYGRSTGWIIFAFLGLAFVFALLYRLFPNLVVVYDNVGDIRGFCHALYFSVVTMTTLGFGDIAANPDSWAGQTLLMAQVILGYVLLGALVTRFAVLFTAGGPAGEFSNEKKIKNKNAKNKTTN